MKVGEKRCGACIKPTSGSPTGLKKHLETHNISLDAAEPPQCKQAKIEHYMGVELIPPGLKRDVAELVAVRLMPVNWLIASNVLRRWAHATWKTELPLAHKTLWKWVEEVVNVAKTKIFELMEAQKSMPALDADEWTSSNGKRFINVNAHINGQIYSLGLARIDEKANADFLSSLVQKKMKEFKVNAVFMTTDGASVMSKMCKNINLIQQKCFLHGINLAIRDTVYNSEAIDEPLPIEITESDDSDVLESVDLPTEDIELRPTLKSLIDKVRTCLKKFMGGNKMDALYKITERIGTESVAVVLDVKTRWNSLLPMLRCFVKLFTALRTYASENDEEFQFTFSDKENLTKVADMLEHVELAIKEIGKEDANLMSADISVTKCCTKLDEIDTDLAREMNTNLIFRYTQRRQVYSDILWKLEGMDKMDIRNLFYHPPSEESMIELQQILKPVDKVSIADADPLDIAKNPEKYKASYFDKDLLINVLRSVKPSSISCERAFSVCARVMIPIRAKLAGEKLDWIIFLNHFFVKNLHIK